MQIDFETNIPVDSAFSSSDKERYFTIITSEFEVKFTLPADKKERESVVGNLCYHIRHAGGLPDAKGNL